MANFEQEKLDLQARVINYATGVQDGSINACVKTKWGVKRFFNDLKKTEKKDSDFYVDWNELLKQSLVWNVQTLKRCGCRTVH